MHNFWEGRKKRSRVAEWSTRVSICRPGAIDVFLVFKKENKLKNEEFVALLGKMRAST